MGTPGRQELRKPAGDTTGDGRARTKVPRGGFKARAGSNGPARAAAPSTLGVWPPGEGGEAMVSRRDTYARAAQPRLSAGAAPALAGLRVAAPRDGGLVEGLEKSPGAGAVEVGVKLGDHVGRKLWRGGIFGEEPQPQKPGPPRGHGMVDRTGQICGQTARPYPRGEQNRNGLQEP